MSYSNFTYETDVDKAVGDSDANNDIPSEIRSNTGCDCTNQVCTHNTSDKQRGKLLREYIDSLPVEPLLMPLSEGKEPIIQKKGIALDSNQAQELLVTPEEAIQRLESGENGFALYAGKPSHNTEELVFADHDDLDTFSLDTLPDTLTVMSGSGEGYHETYLKGGEIDNSKATGEMKGGGEIRALNWYVVTPGSIHPSGGIYHTVKQRELATLSTDQIPSDLQKNSYTSEGEETEVTEADLSSLSVEKSDIDIAIQYLNEWKNENMSAFYCLQDRLKGGRGDYGEELSKEEGTKIDRDLQEKTILTHLYGIFHKNGYSDSRAIELANTLLTHYCREEPHTKDGQARKWAKRRENYRTKQLRYAAIQFDKDKFRKFENKTTKAATHERRNKNEYSPVTRDICLFVVDCLSGEYDDLSPEAVYDHILPEFSFSLGLDEVKAVMGLCDKADHMYNDMRGYSSTLHQEVEVSYPKKSTVKQVAKQVDGVYKGSREKSTFDRCLRRLQREGKLKAACMKEGTDRMLYYPNDMPDPTEAEYIKHNGERRKCSIAGGEINE